MQSDNYGNLILRSQIAPLMYVEASPKQVHSFEAKTKRIYDLLVATFVLLLTSPIYLVVSLSIKYSSRGSVLYAQRRVGQKGELFTLYKFRTMKANSDDEVHRNYVTKLIGGEIKKENLTQDEKWRYKLNHDPRITRLGGFLRTWSLDELPQLFNVIKGDMSMVGPRPPIPYEVEKYSAWQLQRLDALPGITGLWQVNGRSRTNFDDMVRMDIQYIRNSSFLQDIKISLKTFKAIYSRDGAL